MRTEQGPHRTNSQHPTSRMPSSWQKNHGFLKSAVPNSTSLVNCTYNPKNARLQANQSHQEPARSVDSRTQKTIYTSRYHHLVLAEFLREQLIHVRPLFRVLVLQKHRQDFDGRVQFQHIRPSPALDTGNTNARLETDISRASRRWRFST